MIGKWYKNNFHLDVAYGDGHRAQEQGLTIDDNPFEPDTDDYQAWADGFNGNWQ
jgi:hypothetical protein